MQQPSNTSLKLSFNHSNVPISELTLLTMLCFPKEGQSWTRVAFLTSFRIIINHLQFTACITHQRVFLSSLNISQHLFNFQMSSEKFLSFYKGIMDAQYFPSYIILSNYVWSILFYQNKDHNVRRIRFHVCIKMHRCKRRVCWILSLFTVQGRIERNNRLAALSDLLLPNPTILFPSSIWILSLSIVQAGIGRSKELGRNRLAVLSDLLLLNPTRQVNLDINVIGIPMYICPLRMYINYIEINYLVHVGVIVIRSIKHANEPREYSRSTSDTFFFRKYETGLTVTKSSWYVDSMQ